ncbi:MULTISPECIES: DUF2164 domain-containing protein [unclassified Paenibacillus]|uniref:DUF2164 domain-containing protein n=1 Tax=unclassified Paenibacillus TaxID=185978 RepID=UPI000955CF9C|nr:MULTISPECIES: DUF2164 domain-containing protein [unclassified Paenibacillus]ASS69261.1 DUF2164 domain-containing protein [Paenibacillus sp. RUD330]SIP94897.1 Uncharacterized conserved protein, DUF2164 family [Paenibacillus sp. RU4X]SIQ13393.1 Uncharacterized conserved protein, DUF2164 family [Paenibacillus sp. RU4T]
MQTTKLPKEQKKQLIGELQHYFLMERDEELGELPAELMLDFMLSLLSPVIRNQAVEDAVRTVRERMGALEEDLYSLQQASRTARK